MQTTPYFAVDVTNHTGIDLVAAAGNSGGQTHIWATKQPLRIKPNETRTVVSWWREAPMLLVGHMSTDGSANFVYSLDGGSVHHVTAKTCPNATGGFRLV